MDVPTANPGRFGPFATTSGNDRLLCIPAEDPRRFGSDSLVEHLSASGFVCGSRLPAEHRRYSTPKAGRIGLSARGHFVSLQIRHQLAHRSQPVGR